MMAFEWQLYVIIGLAVLAGLMLGLLIGGTPKRKKILRKAQDDNYKNWVNPTYNVRQHEKIEICGAEFERM